MAETKDEISENSIAFPLYVGFTANAVKNSVRNDVLSGILTLVLNIMIPHKAREIDRWSPIDCEILEFTNLTNVKHNRSLEDVKETVLVRVRSYIVAFCVACSTNANRTSKLIHGSTTNSSNKVVVNGCRYPPPPIIVTLPSLYS